jgi:hypothetical protein
MTDREIILKKSKIVKRASRNWCSDIQKRCYIDEVAGRYKSNRYISTPRKKIVSQLSAQKPVTTRTSRTVSIYVYRQLSIEREKTVVRKTFFSLLRWLALTIQHELHEPEYLARSFFTVFNLFRYPQIFTYRCTITKHHHHLRRQHLLSFSHRRHFPAHVVMTWVHLMSSADHLAMMCISPVDTWHWSKTS